MLKHRPPSNTYSSPTKVNTHIKAQYKRVVDRIGDDPVLCTLSIPLFNINAKSISMFITKEEKKANLKATVIAKVKRHQRSFWTSNCLRLPTCHNTLQHLVGLKFSTQLYLMLPARGEERRGELTWKNPSQSLGGVQSWFPLHQDLCLSLRQHRFCWLFLLNHWLPP